MNPRFAERFLHSPDLFPARVAGEPWGAHEIALDFAGGPYVFTGLSADQEAGIRDRFSDTCRPDAEARNGVACRLFRVSSEEFRRFDLRGFELTLDLDPAEDCLRIAGLDLMARIEWRPSLEAALWTPSSGGEGFACILENLLRVMAAHRLVERGGALLHSAGIVDNGAAWLFLGRSGAGKSTLSRLSLAEDRRVLSDDLNALLPISGEWRVMPVPFAGDCRSSDHETRPLASVCQLRQGEGHRLDPLRRAEGLAALVAAAPYVNQDAHRLDRLLSNLLALLDSRTVHRLTFSREDGVWQVLHAGEEAHA
jgi:hypothetical protein